ncbi:S9 family peptidase [Acidicapsa ligni]|uniref:S9 family peptidase n=1 Tax=Acidicapsa ligni TaxID=542300 RepID=UPI0021DF729F|nr:S9 family peptidase [Acidicapsa ligni]
MPEFTLSRFVYRGLLAFGLVAALLPLNIFADTPAKRTISLDDLARIARVGSPVISPDGTLLLYSVSRIDTKEDKGHSELWMVRWDGSNAVQLTFGKDSASRPAFSPDGKYISFLSSRAGKAKGTQVWVLNRMGGEADQFTGITEQELHDYAWSPDSKHLLLTLEPKSEPDGEEGKPTPPKPIVIDRYHFKQDIEGYLGNDQREALYLYDLSTKKFEKLTTDKNVEEGKAIWSPNGAWIAYVSNHDEDPDRSDNSDVFVVATKSGSTAKKLTNWIGPDGGRLAWSPDSKSIAYTQGAKPELGAYSQARPALVTVDGAVSYPAAKLDRSVSQPCFLTDGKLLYLVNDDRSEYPAEVELAGDGVHRLLSESGTTTSLECVAGHIAVGHTDDTHFGEIYALEGNSLRQLSRQNDALQAELTLVPTEDFTSKSKDGTEVHGLLTRPVGYKAGQKVPTILFIHGGPNGQDDHSFAFERQWFAAHGYAEINVNYRGSSGRGQDYAKAIFADWGHLEVIDLLGAVDEVVKMGVADPAKLGIGGWSYGGILTDYTTASDDRFKAAISGAGSAAPLSFYGSDEYVLQYDNELGVPWKARDLYLKLSYPLLEADKRMHTPTLYMGGINDFNVPIIGGEQMYQALKSLHVPTELIVYPGQFHGFTRPSFIKDRYERWLAWYDHYVAGKDTPASPIAKPAPKPTPETPAK